MSETKPEYEIEGGTLQDALQEQFQALHKEYDRLAKQPGEFTTKEYMRAVGIGYDRAVAELSNAERDGEVIRRKSGGRNYFRMNTE